MLRSDWACVAVPFCEVINDYEPTNNPVCWFCFMGNANDSDLATACQALIHRVKQIVTHSLVMLRFRSLFSSSVINYEFSHSSVCLGYFHGYYAWKTESKHKQIELRVALNRVVVSISDFAEICMWNAGSYLFKIVSEGLTYFQLYSRIDINDKTHNKSIFPTMQSWTTYKLSNLSQISHLA